MFRDLRRVLGLWHARRPWLWFGLGVAALSALVGLALLGLAGQRVALGGAALALQRGGGGLDRRRLRRRRAQACARVGEDEHVAAHVDVAVVVGVRA